MRKLVKEDLGADLENLFSEFDPVPLASASIAQVHKAKTADGEDVAVKVIFIRKNKIRVWFIIVCIDVFTH